MVYLNQRYHLYYNQQYIFNNYASGNAQKNMETEKLKRKFKIPVPSLEKQEEIVNKIEELELETSHYNQYTKMLQTELDNINEIINIMTIKSNNSDQEQINQSENLEDSEENSDNQSECLEESEENSDNQSEKSKDNNKQIIEYKNKTYILENDKIYKINKNGNKDKQYGTLINGKVKKIKSDKEIII